MEKKSFWGDLLAAAIPAVVQTAGGALLAKGQAKDQAKQYEIQKVDRIEDFERQRAAKLEDLRAELELKKEFGLLDGGGGSGVDKDAQAAQVYQNAATSMQNARQTQILNLSRFADIINRSLGGQRG